MSLLEVNGLKKHFDIHGGIFYRKIATVFAVDGMDFTIDAGQTVGLVGESGCGKSTVGKTLLRLYDPTEGRVTFDGHDLSHVRRKQLQSIRKDIQMIFQDPFESLNSRHTVGAIIEEPFVIHNVLTPTERREKVIRLLDRVGLPAISIHKYPHEFSGGQRQRIGIARAVALKPKLIICDEPVSALDVSIQSQVLNLLMDLQEEMNLAYLFIAHDLAVVKHISDKILVMYLGRVVEYADAKDIYKKPLHPYTQALTKAIPVPDPRKRTDHKPIEGEIPSPITPPKGCHFHTRCPNVRDKCRIDSPSLELRSGHLVACHFADN